MTQPTLVRRSVGSVERFISDNQIVVNFEPTFAANNGVVLCIQLDGPTASVTGVVDDKTNPNWGSLVGSTIGATGLQSGDVWAVFGAAKGTSQATISFGSTSLFRSCIALEYAFLANGTVAAVKDCPVQTNTNASSPVSPSAALATVTDGDLILQFVWDGNDGANASAPVRGAGFAVVAAQGIDGQYVQHAVQAAHANLTPALTIAGGLTAYGTICVALKADPTKGGAPLPTSVELLGTQAQNSQSGTTYVLPFPCFGNCLVVRSVQGVTGNFVVSVSDKYGNNYLPVPNAKIDNGGTQQAELWVAANARTADDNVVTIVYAQDTNPGPGMMILDDVGGAKANPVGASGTASGTQSVNANLACITLACQAADSLVIACGGINNHTSLRVVPPATGMWATDVMTEPTSNGANESMDEADSYWHYKPGTTAPVQTTWSIQNNGVVPVGVGTWAQAAVEILPAACLDEDGEWIQTSQAA